MRQECLISLKLNVELNCINRRADVIHPAASSAELRVETSFQTNTK